MKKNVKKPKDVNMTMKSFVEEHEKLLRVLTSGTKEDRKKEAKKQEKELKKETK